MKFDEYSFDAFIKENLKQLGFLRPTDIQFRAIPPIMRGEDLFAIAQTGTGKTAAFAIPLINRIHTRKKSRRSEGGVSTLIMVPTRELALQIGTVFNSIAKGTRVNIFTLHGGVEQDVQIERLQKGVDVLIATPGRMFDLISQKKLSIHAVYNLVLDEADRMLDLGFLKDIEYVKKMLTMKHQTLFFSATITPEIKKIAFSIISSGAIRIEISPKDPVSKNVTHALLRCSMDDKRHFLESILRDYAEEKVIVFVRTKVRADRVQKAMTRVGIATESLHSDRAQNERTAVMQKFRNGEVRVLIATDISARGIDIPDIAIVVNYDLPEVAENYVHRIGRTGRGFNKGNALALCAPEEEETLREIEAFIGKSIAEVPLSRAEYTEVLATASDRSSQESMKSLEAIMAEHEEWEKGRKKRRK